MTNHHLFILPPVGWGSMISHISSKVTVITDGGTLRNCFHSTLKHLQHSTLKHTILTNPSLTKGKWCWILSHMDYDHASIVTALIENKFWIPPRITLLPETYNSDICREAFLTYMTLLEVLAHALQLPPPRIIDLVRILVKNAGEKIGVKQGNSVVNGDIVYEILWPPPTIMQASRCKELLIELREKLSYICKHTPQHCKELPYDLLETIKPKTIGDKQTIILDDLIESMKYSSESTHPSSDINTFIPELSISSTEIISKAARRLKYGELLALHRNIINTFSIAYVVSISSSHKAINKEVNVALSNLLSCKKYIIYSVPEPDSDTDIILYLGDLSGRQLAEAIEYYKNKRRKSGLRPLIEVAPHHGNGYSSMLSQVKPTLVVMQRCNKHVPFRWRGSYNCIHYMMLRLCTQLVRTLPLEHENVVSVVVY